MRTTLPTGDDDNPITLDAVKSRILRALLELGSIQEIGNDADADLLLAEQALHRVLMKIDR